MRLFFCLFLSFLCSCGFASSEEKIFVYSSGYKYKGLASSRAIDISDEIFKDPPSKIIFVACPASTPSMIISLQQLLSLKNSGIPVSLIRDDCV